MSLPGDAGGGDRALQHLLRPCGKPGSESYFTYSFSRVVLLSPLCR